MIRFGLVCVTLVLVCGAWFQGCGVPPNPPIETGSNEVATSSESTTGQTEPAQDAGDTETSAPDTAQQDAPVSDAAEAEIPTPDFEEAEPPAPVLDAGPSEPATPDQAPGPESNPGPEKTSGPESNPGPERSPGPEKEPPTIVNEWEACDPHGVTSKKIIQCAAGLSCVRFDVGSQRMWRCHQTSCSLSSTNTCRTRNTGCAKHPLNNLTVCFQTSCRSDKDCKGTGYLCENYNRTNNIKDKEGTHCMAGTVVPKENMYIVTQSKLYRIQHDPRPAINNQTPRGWPIEAGYSYAKTTVDGEGYVYSISSTGTLYVSQHKSNAKTSSDWHFKKRKLGTGWGFPTVLAGGNGILYTIQKSGDLLYYRHSLPPTGTSSWKVSGKTIGTGWDTFAKVIAGRDRVLYAVTKTGELWYFRHAPEPTSNNSWEVVRNQIGTGWDTFRHVIAGGKRDIYAIDKSGNLYYYRHKYDPKSASDWEIKKRKLGTGWNYTQIFGG
ncbi:MAG: hypothetical protein EP343_34345 [Deltaproteobacteria bacterium]|nr:MAG: hypothetical protein EP343_34345 [Deltaproteobacteria bacterium]